ncbi:Nrap protein [Terfezia boudieri ATCC MYA-4762]|uniref:U3 small nucleolar RNA-associated protein 22 n=1 Tax=Terfezia boudieri ATCC MYA-4762 TaxID=1051890 RepID=A0A3N4M683_9PEZI|nr:Nrap protein [Terfezia boudieri ATCC MYA-4762]
MGAESPQKKQKIGRESGDRSDEFSHNDRAPSREEIDVTSIANRNDHQRGKKRGANQTLSILSNTAKLSQMYEYKSNVFRMETDELLAEVKVDYKKRMGPVERALHKLKSIIDSISAKEPAMVNAEKDMIKRHKIVIPFPTPKPTKNIKYKFGYEKPAYVNVVGSFPMKTMTKESGGNNVDLVVQMPSSLFQEKDYLNYRYFHKRAFYLASLAAGIHEANDFRCNISFGLLNGDALRPVLLVAPSEYDFTKSKCTIRVIPCVSPDVFPVKKLALSKNCVRPATDPEATPNTTLPPTPTYNSSVLADTAYMHHLKLLHASASHSAAFRDACILGRVWLRQRGFTSDVASGGIGNFEWSALMAYLMKAGSAMGGTVLSGGYSNYQLFKGTLQFLAARDLIKNPLVVNGVSEGIHWSDTPIVMDGEIGLNLFFKMSPWAYRMLRYEANLTLNALNSSAQDQFDAIFLNRVDEPYLRYDLICNIPVPAEVSAAANSPDNTDLRVTFARRLYSVFLHGLADRVRMITLKLPEIQPWDTRKEGGGLSAQKTVTASFFLSGEKCHRLIDHGPSAENKKEANSFRKFWGEKAELRRFKDGSILESIFWGDSKDPKTPVIHQVISYIVKHHFSPDISQGIAFIGDEYAQLLSKHQLPGAQATTKLFQPVMTGYDTLVKGLRSIEDLPLIIRHITPISSALRFSTIHPPLPGLNSGILMDTPADVALQFESSGRWPDDLVAIQRTKAAFLLRIGQLLKETSTDGDISTRVGLENQELGREIFNASFLDVIYHSGPTFRIRIHHEREAYLLQRQTKDKTLLPQARDLASQALTIYDRTFVKSPIHTTCIAKLCHRHAYLSPTIRLVKKWFAAHLLSCHFSEELIELIVTLQFVSPFPWSAPSSIMTGFLRTLKFLATWDWRVDPLIVDTSDGDSVDPDNLAAGIDTGVLKPTDIESITEKFEGLRKFDPGLNRTVLFAATNYDHDGITWTENGPSRVVAARMTALARSAIEHAKKNGSENVGTIFAHALADYDFVIHLDPMYLAGVRGSKGKGSKYKNLPDLQMLQTGFNPTHLFLQDLQRIYTSSLVFFHGSTSTTVGALWAPHTSNVRPWKVNLACSTIPTTEYGKSNNKSDHGDDEEAQEEPQNDKGMLAINKSAILNEIARLGGELVERIEINR